MTVINEKFVQFDENSDGKSSEIIWEIIVDTADELPEKDGISGKSLHQGSVAYVVKTGEFYVLASDGKWHNVKKGEEK